jgi:tetratricopeptide (TPR) repeat protein
LFVLLNTVEAFALLYLGEWGKVQQSLASALAITVRNANPQAGVLCQLTVGWLHAEAQDFESAARRAEETLNPTVEANPFNFFVGRNLLARAYIGLRNLPLARKHLDAMERRIEIEGVAMESLVVPRYFLNRCDYWLQAGDLDRARNEALRLHEFTATAPDRPFLAFSHSVMAQVAMAARNSQEARFHLSQAISIVRNARLPLAAWRVWATAASFYEGAGDAEKAAKCRCRSDQIVRSLADSLEPSDPLRSVMLFARAGVSAADKS